MKCSSQRNCNAGSSPGPARMSTGLNEVQLPKELQLRAIGQSEEVSHASMKCSSQRNCNNKIQIAGIGHV